ncbi:MAG TPA: hypothetical protein VMF88_00740 [Bacteroidota bacterium]|nr:hypothetical protein [Bacteroidota bacterium]
MIVVLPHGDNRSAFGSGKTAIAPHSESDISEVLFGSIFTVTSSQILTMARELISYPDRLY